MASGSMAATLLIGSCEPFSGKSALVLGLGRQLLRRGLPVRFGKPLATTFDAPCDASEAGASLIDADVRFVAGILGLAEDQLIHALHRRDPGTAHDRLQRGDRHPGEGFAAWAARLSDPAAGGIALLEAPGSLHEGLLFGLSLGQLARALKAPVLLVQAWTDSCSLEPLLAAQDQLGDHLAGVVLNGVDPEAVPDLLGEGVPCLERLGLPVLGVMPRSPLLRSVSVAELARRLAAQVLCCADRLDLLVETLSIGAMNVNSAMEFFRRRRNMAVVTGADRTDIQLAALEASTQCLILTGAGEPLPQLLNRAEELDVPVLKVEHDTLTTVEVVEQAFGHVRLHEVVKATYAVRLVEEHCDFEPLFHRLKLPALTE